MIRQVLSVFFQSLAFSQYYNQYGQDKFVHENFFKNRRGGVFVDIGAHNGISLSNTYFFERELVGREFALNLFLRYLKN